MKFVIGVCLAGSMICGLGAQDRPVPPLQKGVHVEMPVAGHPVAMPAADEPDAAVVAITVGGEVFLGIKPTDPTALSNLSAETVYVKADARVPFQKVLAVLDALRGKSVVLLTAPPGNAERAGMVPPYGMTVKVSR